MCHCFSGSSSHSRYVVLKKEEACLNTNRTKASTSFCSQKQNKTNNMFLINLLEDSACNTSTDSTAIIVVAILGRESEISATSRLKKKKEGKKETRISFLSSSSFLLFLQLIPKKKKTTKMRRRKEKLVNCYSILKLARR